jgi:hypothetical protein
MDHNKDAVTGGNGSTPSKADGDAMMEITYTPVTETPGQSNSTPVHDSSPTTASGKRQDLLTTYGSFDTFTTFKRTEKLGGSHQKDIKNHKR